MTWWQIALLCYAAYWVGSVSATTIERERYNIWMANSWELINRRLWWLSLLNKKNGADLTVNEVAGLIENMVKTVNDYNTVFGRPYRKEPLLGPETVDAQEEVKDG